jgi:hypothetical protein
MKVAVSVYSVEHWTFALGLLLADHTASGFAMGASSQCGA